MKHLLLSAILALATNTCVLAQTLKWTHTVAPAFGGAIAANAGPNEYRTDLLGNAVFLTEYTSAGPSASFLGYRILWLGSTGKLLVTADFPHDGQFRFERDSASPLMRVSGTFLLVRLVDNVTGKTVLRRYWRKAQSVVTSDMTLPSDDNGNYDSLIFSDPIPRDNDQTGFFVFGHDELTGFNAIKRYTIK